MPDILTPPSLPSTPAEVAAAVLDGIENYPGAFDMENWASLEDTPRLEPHRPPTCGTAMCAAGWTAHVTGWSLVDLPSGEEVEVFADRADGTQYLTRADVYAEKDGERRLICDVAREALGLTDSNTFWYQGADTALERLREIAGR
ncbi:hypothetical protein ABZX77_05880 [Streptomyces sp. NPDC004237]|uniref:hypothetical protein n=1 Tax=Streptomyces sp. NPDC004237 TaxID=3154455 RepID=UPI0033B5FCA2